MKHFNLITLFVISFFFASCGSNLVSLKDGKQIDKRLVGTWIGSEKDEQIEGVEKSWKMIRNDDGTFMLFFVFNQNDEIVNSIEEGNWWIENGKFYEYHEDSGNTDLYKYKVLDKNRIKFISENMSVEMNSDSYSFIDTRINDEIKNELIEKNGLSFETAIEVSSVKEEYDFIRLNCRNCSFISQSLSEYKKQMFDLIKVNTEDGSSITYYFNINSFFGKF